MKEKYKEEDVAYSFDIENTIIEEDTLFSTAYCNDNTIFKDFGIQLSDRVFVKMKDINKFENRNDGYCLVSNNFKLETQSLKKKNISYPIVGTFQLDMTSEIRKSFQQSGIKDIQLALFVDKSIPVNNVNLIIDNSKNQYIINSSSFSSGKELNDQIIDGYSLFQPMIYVGFLIPMIACAFSFLLILSSIQNKSIEELKTLRILSFKKKDIFHLLFYERLFECFIGAVFSYILFIPIYILFLKNFYACSFIVFFIQLIYSVSILFFYSKREVNNIYKNGGRL